MDITGVRIIEFIGFQDGGDVYPFIVKRQIKNRGCRIGIVSVNSGLGTLLVLCDITDTVAVGIFSGIVHIGIEAIIIFPIIGHAVSIRIQKWHRVRDLLGESALIAVVVVSGCSEVIGSAGVEVGDRAGGFVADTDHVCVAAAFGPVIYAIAGHIDFFVGIPGEGDRRRLGGGGQRPKAKGQRRQQKNQKNQWAPKF